MATERQLRRAIGREFVVPIYGRVVFRGVAPTGYALAMRRGDAARGFGAFCLDRAATDDLMKQIAA